MKIANSKNEIPLTWFCSHPLSWPDCCVQTQCDHGWCTATILCHLGKRGSAPETATENLHSWQFDTLNKNKLGSEFFIIFHFIFPLGISPIPPKDIFLMGGMGGGGGSLRHSCDPAYQSTPNIITGQICPEFWQGNVAAMMMMGSAKWHKYMPVTLKGYLHKIKQNTFQKARYLVKEVCDRFRSFSVNPFCPMVRWLDSDNLKKKGLYGIL